MSAYHFFVVIRCIDAIRTIIAADYEENGTESYLYGVLPEYLDEFENELERFVIRVEEIPSRLRQMMRYAVTNKRISSAKRGKIIAAECEFYTSIGELNELSARQ